MKRREFLRTTSMLAGGVPVLMGAAAPPTITKRQRMLDWLAGKTEPNYTPAAFFLHFAPEYKAGTAAAGKHIEFFRETDMDFVKVQFEQTYERQDFLQKPADWSKLKLRKLDFYEPLLVTVRELVKSVKSEALILMTLYSPYMCAGHCATSPVLRRHLEEDPEAVKKGLDILIESQMLFVRACIDAGVDGFYMSTQGSEAGMFSTPKIFANYIKPADLVAMNEIQRRCQFNILHVCDYVAGYSSYDIHRDYPGHVVNCNPRLKDKTLAWSQVQAHFKRPCMGGLDRHGLLAKGTVAEVEEEARQVIQSAPRQFILGADCTVAGNTDWKRLQSVISVAHKTARRTAA